MELKNLTYTRPVTQTVEEVYGRLPSVPDGYEVVGFEPPKQDQFYLDSNGLKINKCITNFLEEPRIIVCKKKLVLNRWMVEFVVPEGYKPTKLGALYGDYNDDAYNYQGGRLVLPVLAITKPFTKVEP